MSIDVTCAVVIKHGKVLLTQRGEQMDHAGQWEFPGGKCKSGEAFPDCIRREIQEELSASLTVLEHLPPVEHTYPGKRIRLYPFLCKIEVDEISLTEHQDFDWFHTDDIGKGDILPADIKIINHLSENGYL